MSYTDTWGEEVDATRTATEVLSSDVHSDTDRGGKAEAPVLQGHPRNDVACQRNREFMSAQ